ncbi:MAG: hypothetical protein M3N47_09485, partial [Chloroflexota bacterium]|nr:hypothetical protein [Chloroflexota bacterium]
MSESAAKNQLRLIGNTARAALANRRFDRRALVAGGAVAGAALIGVAGAAMLRDDAPEQSRQPVAETGQTNQANAVQQSPSTPEAASTPPPDFVAGDLPEGFALVTSPRLPLWGVGEEQASALAQGAVRDWSEVGAPLDLPVRTVALEGFVAEGLEPAEGYPDYDALVAGLDKERGSVALLPVEQIDYFVNTLSVDGIDPLPAAGSDDEPVWRMA